MFYKIHLIGAKNGSQIDALNPQTLSKMKKKILSLCFCGLLLNFEAIAQTPSSDLLGASPDGARPEGVPGGALGLEKPYHREKGSTVKEVKQAFQDGKISLSEAKRRAHEIRKKMAEEGQIVRPERQVKPEFSDEVKDQLDAIKEKQDSLHAELKETLSGLGEEATKEDMKAAARAFKESNKERFEAIKAEHEAIREQLEAARPERPERPEIELSEDLKEKVKDLKSKREALHEAQKEILRSLQDATKEERMSIIAEFKELNKAKHEEIKQAAQALKEQIRENVETEATRTSDL